MENIFSTNPLQTIEKEINIDENQKENFQVKDLNLYFECQHVAKWINSKGYERVALQFPDELLTYSTSIALSLGDKCTNSVVFILGDTSYGSCCVDVVAGEHYNANAIVHFGHSCLSKLNSIPVYYVFDKYDVNMEQIRTDLNALLNENCQSKILILYDLSYYHLYGELKLLEKENEIYLTGIDLDENQYALNKAIASADVRNDTLELYSRILPRGPLNNPNTVFYYIGSNEKFLNSFQLYFNQMQFFKYHHVTNPNENMKRLLMKRYYLIEKAKDANIFGILIGTMAVAQYKEAMEHASKLIKSAKRKYYTFLIGKINCAKLNNFMEVDMYVLIACNENSLIDSKDLNKPCITLYELEVAFNYARTWGNEFICNYNDLLPGMKHYVPLEVSSKETDVSLVTGSIRTLKTDANDENEIRKEIIKRDDALSLLHYSGAGEFLSNRSWTGLEQKLGETEVTKAVEGRKGIASSYTHEPE